MNEFIAKVESGVANVYEKSRMAAHIKSLDGHEIKIKITKLVVSKSPEQLSGLHLLITWFTELLNDHTGQDISVEKVKDMLKAKREWTEDIVDLKTGEVMGQKLKSFADLTLFEASDWITYIYSYAATEWGFTLPILEKNKISLQTT